MSFGFSVSDLAAASRLAWRIYKSCKDSSHDFMILAADVANLHVALRETEDYCEGQVLSIAHQERLDAVCKSCTFVLNAIDTKLEKYASLGTPSQRTWDRLRWGMEDAAALRDQLVSSASVLTVLNTSLANSSQARIEKKLNQLLTEIRTGKREKSLVSVSTIQSLSQDDKEAYKELKRDLEDVGIDMDLFMQHRKFIVSWFQEALISSGFESGSSAEGTILARSLSTLVEAEKPQQTSERKSSTTLHESKSPRPEDKRMSDSLLRESMITALPQCEEPDDSQDLERFPRFLQQDQTREPSKKRRVFKRALKGLSIRMSFREGIESPLRTPLSPKSGSRSLRQSSIDHTPNLPPAPPIPLIDPKVLQRIQTRKRSNTSKTVVTRWSASGGEIDLATGLPSKSRSSIVEAEKRRSHTSTAPRPQSESITDYVSGPADVRGISATMTADVTTKRLSHELFGPQTHSKHHRKSDNSIPRRPSETPSDQSTKRSSRTSAALSPYERETFERHNATMKAYFERRPEQESKLAAARRSLQSGLRPHSRAPPLPIHRLVTSGPEGQAPAPLPKDERYTRRHTQPTTPTSARGLESMPSASSLASADSAHSGPESGLLTVMLPPELLEAYKESQTDQVEQKPETEEESLMRELTGPLKRFSINANHENGETYLLKAAAKGFSEAVVYLLQNGANVLMKNMQGQDALHAAVASNKPDTVRAVLESIPANSIPELWQTTILHTAVQVKSIEIVESLLKSGANTNFLDADGRTAYELATHNEMTDIAELLLKHAAQISKLEPADEDCDEDQTEDEGLGSDLGTV